MELPSLETPHGGTGQTSIGNTKLEAQLARLMQFLPAIVWSIHFHFPISTRSNGKISVQRDAVPSRCGSISRIF